MGIRIITDSTADFSNEEVKMYNIEVVPLLVNFGGDFYRERLDITSEGFYERLMVAKELPGTSQPSPNDYLRIFHDADDKKDEVIVITISSKLSGTYQNCVLAQKLSQYESIDIIDSLNTTLGQKVMVLQAIRMRDEGKSCKEIVEFLETRKKDVTLLVYLDTLDYLVKGGRVSRVAGVAGEILGIRPVVTIIDGEVTTLSKERGRVKALNAILSLINETGYDPDLPICYGYTYPYETGVEVKKFFIDNGFPEADITSVGAVVGTHGGPNAGGIGYYKKLK